MIRNLLFLLSIMFSIQFSHGFTYHVKMQGSDNNPGSKDFPFRSVKKAALVAVAGDSIMVSEGTYYGKVMVANSGTYNNPIVFTGVGTVFLMGNSEVTRWTGIVNIAKKRHITFRNFSVQDSYWFGFYIYGESEYINISKCKTYNTGSSGIYAISSKHVNADSNSIRKACYQSLESTASQEFITFNKVINFRIANNKVYESGGSTNGGEGINAKDGSKNGRIARNEVHDLERLGIYVDSYDQLIENIQVYSNKVYNCSYGIALASEQGGLLRNINIYNNLCYKNRVNGIIVSAWVNNGPKLNIQIVNNTCIRNGSNGWGGGIIVEKGSSDSLYVANNLCYNNVLWGISMPTGIVKSIKHNLVYPFNNKFWTSEVLGENPIVTDPMLSDPYNSDPAGCDLSLKSASPAINKGTAINAPDVDFAGNFRSSTGVDIGAYECNSHSSNRIEDVLNIIAAPENEGETEIEVFYDNYSKAIKLNKPTSFAADISVIDLKGNIVIRQPVTGTSSSIPLPNLTSNVYIVKVVEGAKRISKRILIE